MCEPPVVPVPGGFGVPVPGGFGGSLPIAVFGGALALGAADADASAIALSLGGADVAGGAETGGTTSATGAVDALGDDAVADAAGLVTSSPSRGRSRASALE